MLSQQRTFGRVRLQGEQPELAFVVGLDDTPTGLFVHAIDGTRLDVNQSVTRDYIHSVMGFNDNYDHSETVISGSGGTRLQGDLAIERISDKTTSGSRCNIPVDNHLCMFSRGTVPEDETRDEEPVRVCVPSMSTLNVLHDEHDNVNVELEAGTYELYLLHRGLQVADERPDWPPTR